MPSSPAPEKAKPSLPGRTTVETARKDIARWEKIGEGTTDRNQNKWNSFKTRYYDMRGWSVCQCERAGIESPPAKKEVSRPSADWKGAGEEFHGIHGGGCVKATDRKAYMIAAWWRMIRR